MKTFDQLQKAIESFDEPRTPKRVDPRLSFAMNVLIKTHNDLQCFNREAKDPFIESLVARLDVTLDRILAMNTEQNQGVVHDENRIG